MSSTCYEASSSFSLPGRESEFKAVLSFVSAHNSGKGRDVLFMCGACGCGKTSTIRQLMTYCSQYDKTLNTPKVFKNSRWLHLVCKGLSRVGFLTQLREFLVEYDLFFANKFFNIVYESYCMMTQSSGCSSVTNLSGKRQDVNSFLGMHVQLLKEQILSKTTKGRRPKHSDFSFVLALDEADSCDEIGNELMTSLVEACVRKDIAKRISLVLIANNKCLPFIPRSCRSNLVTELVFRAYSAPELKVGVLNYFQKQKGVVLSELLTASAIDFAVKVAINQYSADLRKVIDICAEAVNDVVQKRKVSERSQADEEKVNTRSVKKILEKRHKRPRIDDEIHTQTCESSSPTLSITLSKETQDKVITSTPCPPLISIGDLKSTIHDYQSVLDQIPTLTPYTRHTLQCCINIAKTTRSHSFLSTTIQEEFFKLIDKLRIPRPSQAFAAEALEDLRGMGLLSSKQNAMNKRSRSTTVSRMTTYTLSWSLEELETRLPDQFKHD
eukprot:Tbor_TRINITY_DN4759_c0_g1::TRINITY_DN4759_c0_g1_i1::g.17103::m.17103